MTLYNIKKPGGDIHGVKSVPIRNYSGPHFPPFRLNTERYFVSLRIQSEWGKMWTRITPNTDTFHAVIHVTDVFTEAGETFILQRRLGIEK